MMEKTKEQILMDAINEFRGVDTTVGFIVMAFDEGSYQSLFFNINEYFIKLNFSRFLLI